MLSDGHTQGMRRWWGHRLKRGKDNIAAPRLIPFYVAPISPGSLAARWSAGVVHDIATPWLPG